ncbi:MAG: D-aminoacyl-tRNA deacylase [Myxococcota bacterium]|nr:D-aminoacyl-tRNA deacylase [Myxococcota bacterium]
MRILLQRVTDARVEVCGEIVGRIGNGLVVFVGVGPADTQKTVEMMARKVAGLRVFSDAEGRPNLSVREIDGDCLVVSQFTLFADCKKGRRPFYGGAAEPAIAEPLVGYFSSCLGALDVKVEKGVFGADMRVFLCNEGPITVWLDSEEL